MNHITKIGIVCIFFILVCIFQLNAQSSRRFNDIIQNDSVQLIGNVKKYGDKFVSFSRPQSENKLYTPYQIDEFRVDGKYFKVLNFEGERKFYRRLTDSKIPLFKLDKGYAWYNNDSTYTFRRENFRSVAFQVFGCRSVAKLTYSENALINYSEQFNSKNCNIRYVFNPKHGIIIGYTASLFERVFESNTISSKRSSVYIGILFEQPILEPQLLFGTIEINYLGAEGEYLFEDNSKTMYLQTKIHQVNVPFGLKWMTPIRHRYYTYIRSGLNYSRLTDVASQPLITIERNELSYYTTFTDVTNPKTNSIGYFIGAGIEVQSFKNHLVHLDIRFSNSLIGRNNSNDVKWQFTSICVNYSL